MVNSTIKLASISCRFCQKTFSKGEHLRRHERSHTGARPYRCKECQRPFARQDSLARHEKLHTRAGSNDVNSSLPSPPSSLISKQPTVETPISPLEITDFAIENTPGSAIIEHTDLQDVFADQISVSGTGSGISTMGEDSPESVQSMMQHIPSNLQPDFDLMWPDAEDLFETLLATEASSQWQMPMTALPMSSGSLFNSNNLFEFQSAQGPFGDKGSPDSPIPSGESHKAVHNVSEMVSSLSSSVTAAVEATSLSSVFLDECLHMFFVRFIPTFPVLHRATFVFRECTQPLLLNAMAIGSLYLGPKGSVAKGEALWRLAHVAVTTSWELLITHSGPYDACQGVQLVVTALLAQVYGALSKNRAIRTTSQAFHALSFFWARQCALSSYTSEPTPLPLLSAESSEKNNAWRLWAAKEIQQRALLGHYLVDGLISRMSGEIPSARHAANQLCLPSTEAAFEARTPDDWLIAMHAQSTPQQQPSFRKIISSLFLPSQPIQPLIHSSCSAFSLRVILEGLQSLVPDCSISEIDDGYDTLIGVPTKPSLRRALARIHASITGAEISEPERLELLLRWHTICLDLCKDSSLLCRAVCTRYGITQHVCSGPQHQARFQQKVDLDLVSWAQTEDARRALLHAVAIQEIIEALPRGRAHVIHIPSALFASATVYCVFSLAGQTTIVLPEIVDWQSVLREGWEGLGIGEDNSRAGISETKRYLRGEGGGSGAREGTGLGVKGEKRNLLYELNSMQKLFRCLCSQWGVAYDMEEVVDQWISLCH